MRCIAIELYKWIVDKEGGKNKWKVGCDLNITEDPTVILQVRLQFGKVKVKFPLCTA
jgi:hypothetical protein